MPGNLTAQRSQALEWQKNTGGKQGKTKKRLKPDKFNRPEEKRAVGQERPPELR